MALSKIKGSQLSDDSITVDQIADTAVHGRRNLVINGAMTIDQRNSATTKKTGNEYSVDRFSMSKSGFDQLAYEHGQSTESPDGFSNSMHVKVTTAETTLDVEELLYLTHKIEAQNLQHLQYGTSGAKKTTLSFWVRSSLTGTYSVNFFNNNPATNRSNLQEYTINTANTWEYKTITIDGDTTGTYDNDNGQGVLISWILAAGTNWHGTPHTGWGDYTATDDFASSSNVDFSAQTGDLYITGVQLEVGDTATPFEHRSYGDELHRCMRYYNISGMICATGTPDRYFTQIHLPVEMRASPTLSTLAIDSGSGAQVAPNWDRENNTTSRKSFYQGNPNSVTSSARFSFDAEL